jgi:hypothetical protein
LSIRVSSTSGRREIIIERRSVHIVDPPYEGLVPKRKPMESSPLIMSRKVGCWGFLAAVVIFLGATFGAVVDFLETAMARGKAEEGYELDASGTRDAEEIGR